MDDNDEGRAVTLPEIEEGEEAVYGKPRMFNINQVHQLFHYFLR